MYKDSVIANIRRAIESNSLNFLVGAGFSKNISDTFPTWGELMRPMAEMLYGHSLSCDAEAREKELDGIIMEKGYLNIASEFVRRDGYHAGIDLFIEKRMPYLEKRSDGLYRLVQDGVVIDESPDMRCHEALIGLKADNIFTFNYDNALDIVGDTDSTAEKYRNLRRVNEELVGLDSHSEISIKECERDYWDAKINENYQLILNSYDLALVERRKNIYKLHGSLRKDRSAEKFGFDGDRHKHYIIAQEDYDEYPVKHEAFVNFMKVSLLKGCFCLLGFGGDDPNFLMWIKWVKDVLDKNPEPERRLPIYFVYAGNDKYPHEEIPEEKRILLDNHYITLIDLREWYQHASASERLLAFFKDITPDSVLVEEVDKLWRSFNWSKDGGFLDDDEKRLVEQLCSLSVVRIDPQRAMSQQLRDRMLDRVHRALANNDVVQPEMVKLALCAAKGNLKLLQNCFSANSIAALDRSLIDTDDVVKGSLALHKERFEALTCNAVEPSAYTCKDSGIYNRCWALLFHLRFADAVALLEGWEPEEVFDRARRCILLRMLGQKCEVPLESLLKREDYLSGQDYRYMLSVLSNVYGVWSRDEALFDKVEKLREKAPAGEGGDFVEYRKIILRLLDALDKDFNVSSYGNLPVEYRMDSYDSQFEAAMKLMNIMVELAYPTHAPGLILINKVKWYKAFGKIKGYYPFPAMFFTLLIGGDKQFVRKAAQEVIYSPKLRDVVPVMLADMMAALRDECIPDDIKEAVFIALPIFMKAVPAAVWQGDFYLLVKSYGDDIFDGENRRLDGLRTFVLSGMTQVACVEMKLDVIKMCLSRGEDVNHMCNELIIKASRGVNGVDDEIKKLLSRLLDVASDTAHYFVLLNLSEYVDRKKLAKKLEMQPDSFYDNVPILHGASCFAFRHKGLQAKLKQLVISSDLVWKSGISEDGSKYCDVGDFLDVNLLVKYLQFSPEELKCLFRRMNQPLSSIEKKLGASGWRMIMHHSDWEDLLLYMRDFLIRNAGVLGDESDYDNILQRVRAAMATYGYEKSVQEMLMDKVCVRNVLYDMARNVNVPNLKEYYPAYQFLANILALKKSDSLNSCFVHFAWVMDKYKRKWPKSLFIPLLQMIFAAYYDYFKAENAIEWDIPSAEKDVVEKALVKLAGVYEFWGGQSCFGSGYVRWYAVDD